jgi:hypothetical protein
MEDTEEEQIDKWEDGGDTDRNLDGYRPFRGFRED